MAKDSAGLRIRSHPSLQSEQIGLVKVNGSIIFIDEVTSKNFEDYCNEGWLAPTAIIPNLLYSDLDGWLLKPSETVVDLATDLLFK